MLKIYVCEDNESHRSMMQNTIEEIAALGENDIQVGYITENPKELLDIIKNDEEPGLYFLDIDLGCEMNGMELAKEIRKIQPRCYIVFVTTHSEMSFMTFSYKVEAMDFILKDNPQEIRKRIHQCIVHAIERSNCEEPIKKYSVKLGDRIKNIDLGDILFFEVASESRKIILHTLDAIIEFVGKIKDVENRLDERFIRCHRGYIVNKDFIERIDKEDRVIYMVTGDSCPMSVRLGRKL